MKKILKAAVYSIGALTLLGASAQALEYHNPIESGLTEVKLIETPIAHAPSKDRIMLRRNADIAIARLDGGRMIPTPHGETVDWTYVNRRVDARITQLGSGTYIKYLPEIPFFGQDTDNKIDEIRLAAANEGKDYVLIYGVGPDASLASFGKKPLSQTGLSIQKDCQSWQSAKAKALLVDSFTGDVLGAVTAENIEFNIGELADRVGNLISELTGPVL